MHNPKVSVIIPTFNRAALLGAAIQSVIDQSYVNVEIIVVDDGSTDNTNDVVASFGSRVRYIPRRDGGGAAHARNIGMREAYGEYIAFLDSDDLYLPDKLAIQVEFMEAHPQIGMVSTEVSSLVDNIVNEQRHLRTFHGIYNRKDWRYDDVYSDKKIFLSRVLNREIACYSGGIFSQVLMGPLIVSPTILFRKQIINTVGLQNEIYKYAEEYEFIVRICKQYAVAFLDVSTYLYRYHDNQISRINEKSGDRILTQIEIETAFLNAVMDWGYNDKMFYIEHSEMLDDRISELCCCIGNLWQDQGNTDKAREWFIKGKKFESFPALNSRSLIFSFFPNFTRRIISGVTRRLKTWI